MTLLLRLPVTADTLVFSGDKRIVDSTGFVDTYVKATRVGNNGVGGVCGAPRKVERETKIVQFDITEQLRAFSEGREVSQASIDEFREHLHAQHDVYINKYRGGVHYEKPYRLYSVVICSLQLPGIVEDTIECYWDTEKGFIAEKVPRVLRSSILLAAGDDEAKSILYTPDHPAVRDLYAKSDIARLLTLPAGAPFGFVTVERAVEICRLVTRVCHAIQGEKSTISPDCDVLVLTKERVHPA